MIKKGFNGIKLREGEQVYTATGKLTTPFPKIDYSSSGKIDNTIYRVRNWGLENAILEAEARNDDFNLIWLKQVKIHKNRKKVNEYEMDLVLDYLFRKDFINDVTSPYKWTNKK